MACPTTVPPPRAGDSRGSANIPQLSTTQFPRDFNGTSQETKLITLLYINGIEPIKHRELEICLVCKWITPISVGDYVVFPKKIVACCVTNFAKKMSSRENKVNNNTRK